MKTNHPVSYLLFCLIILFSSCKTNLLVLEDVLPSAKQEDFNVSFAQSSLTNFLLNLHLSYEIKNPYKKDLPIPDHTMGIFVNEKNLGLATEHRAVSIPAKSSLVLDYDFKLDDRLLKSLMGKDNKITFHSSLELDLTDYSDMLPNYRVGVTENFDLETSKLKPGLDKLLKNQIGTYNFEMEHSTHVKIPAFPTLSASSEPIEITLLGAGLDAINPNDIKNALIPFGDLLINGELDGLKDPFIDAVVKATIEVPAPLPNNLDNTKVIRLETEVLKLLRPVDSNIDAKWTDIKSKLYQSATIPVADYMVDNFLDPHIDNQASEKWDMFQDGYNSLITIVLPDEIPGPQTHGFEIAIPFSFQNNNEFPINIPVFRSSVFVSGGQPFSMYVRPKNMGEIPLNKVPSGMAEIPAKTKETLYVVFSFDMAAFNHGIYSLFMQNQFDPNVKGVMSYDFGYGPMYIGYDLQQMDVDYK